MNWLASLVLEILQLVLGSAFAFVLDIQGNGLDWGVRTDPDGVHSFSFPSPPSAENVDEIGFDPTPSDSPTNPQEISVSEVSDSLAPFLGTVKPVFNPPDNDPEHTLHANSIKDFLIRNDAFVIEHGYNPTSQRPRRNPKHTVFYDPSKPSASMAIAPTDDDDQSHPSLDLKIPPAPLSEVGPEHIQFLQVFALVDWSSRIAPPLQFHVPPTAVHLIDKVSSSAMDIEASVSSDVFSQDVVSPDVIGPDFASPDLVTPYITSPDIVIPEFSGPVCPILDHSSVELQLAAMQTSTLESPSFPLPLSSPHVATPLASTKSTILILYHRLIRILQSSTLIQYSPTTSVSHLNKSQSRTSS
jgi:hypothetical protein